MTRGPMDPAQRRHVRIETAIATCACALLPTVAVAFLFGPFPVPVQGADGLVGFALKSTLVAVFLMTALMTLGAHAKLRKGGVPPLARGHFAWLAWVPRALWLRVPTFALGAALVMAAATAVIAGAWHLDPLDRPAFVVFNLVIGALIGLGMTPLIQCAALADGVPAPVPAPAPQGQGVA